MRRSLGQRVEQEVCEVPAEHLLEPCAGRKRLRARVVLGGCGLG
jgi:hypothetical protein